METQEITPDSALHKTDVNCCRSFQIGQTVYHRNVYEHKEPLKIVGILEDKLLLEGDFSGGTHSVCQKDWFDDNEVFVVKTVCEEQLKPNGCQIHNVNCCGGGSVINKHVSYWDALVN